LGYSNKVIFSSASRKNLLLLPGNHTKSWFFAPEGIEVAVSIWHSGQDSLCHISHLENLGERLPNSRLHRVTDGNNYVFAHQWEEAIRLLAAAAAS